MTIDTRIAGAPLLIAIGGWAVTLLLAIGGWAVAFVHGVRIRAYATRLDIGFDYSVLGQDEPATVAVDVTLTNRGSTKLEAMARGADEGFSYRDTAEIIPFSCTLQVRRVRPGLPVGPIDWYSAASVGPPLEEYAANLLAEYEDPDAGKTNFWMEPTECVHLGAALRLTPGTYLAKVTFIGKDGGRSDFWSRIVPFVVPNVDPPQ